MTKLMPENFRLRYCENRMRLRDGESRRPSKPWSCSLRTRSWLDLSQLERLR
jgi:hypothetical protein